MASPGINSIVEGKIATLGRLPTLRRRRWLARSHGLTRLPTSTRVLSCATSNARSSFGFERLGVGFDLAASGCCWH